MFESAGTARLSRVHGRPGSPGAGALLPREATYRQPARFSASTVPGNASHAAQEQVFLL